MTINIKDIKVMVKLFLKFPQSTNVFLTSIIGPKSKYASIELFENDDKRLLPTNESDVEQSDIKYANNISISIDKT